MNSELMGKLEKLGLERPFGEAGTHPLTDADYEQLVSIILESLTTEEGILSEERIIDVWGKVDGLLQQHYLGHESTGDFIQKVIDEVQAQASISIEQGRKQEREEIIHALRDIEFKANSHTDYTNLVLNYLASITEKETLKEVASDLADAIKWKYDH